MTTIPPLFAEGETGDQLSDGTVSYKILDVFTDRPLEGNQLAVFPDGRGLSGEEMQRIARELNLSESVFILPPEADGDARIRIFTPTHELPFAGHPTLGSAFVVAEALGTNFLTLETANGNVPVTLTREGARLVSGRMRQPIPTVEPYDRADDVLSALGVTSSELPVEVYTNGPRHVLVVLGSPGEVAALQPDTTALATHAGVGVSCFAGSGENWKTRMFAPALGVAEDPATGSAAGPLALHLARHGRINFGDEITITQGDEILRPSVLAARVLGSADNIEAVEVGGRAIVVAEGAYLVRSARAHEPPI